MRLGLLRPESGAKGGTRPYQLFTAEHLKAAKVIWTAQSLGMSLKEIAAISEERRAGRMTRDRSVDFLAQQLERLETKARRIGIISTNETISTGRQRFEGYRAALAQAGIALEPRLVTEGPATRDIGAAHMLHLLELPEPPTAVVCFNDVAAFGAMLGLRARGLTPGTDVSVVGFDDIAEATLWRPSLTTVAVARQTVGRTAVQLLLRRIAEPDAPPDTVLLPTELIVRETTAPPRS